MNDRIRARWSALQGLDGALAGATAHDVLERTGWMRSVGGAGPYLGIHARCGASRAAIDAAVAEGEICELPSARGCTYVVPRADYAVALRAGQGHGDAAAIATAKKFLGVTEPELDRLCLTILDALEDGPLDPKALKGAVGDAVRHLGDAGKKRGTTTTLSLGLGRLQGQGRIRRVPVNGRLDQQRYAYVLWTPSPLDGVTLDDEQLAVELARRYFRWIGVASVSQLAWWSGLSKKAAKAAVAELGLQVFEEDQLASAETINAIRSAPVPAEPHVRLVGSLDNLVHLRREVAPIVAEVDRARTVAGGGFTSTPAQTGAAVSSVLDLPHHAVVDRGRLIGVWDYDVQADTIACKLWDEPAGVREAIEEVARFVRDDLGDARAFSLDTPQTRGGRLAALRS